MYPNVQAYDRGTMFSPDGKLYQVEYAIVATKKGATAIGLIIDNGVVLAGEKTYEAPFVIYKTVQKVFRIDHLIGATYSGMVSDGLHLINILRNKAQTHRLLYNEAETIDGLAKDISEEMQVATQYGGLRPYAVSLLLGGVDPNAVVFEIDPSGSPVGYKARAIGQGRDKATEILSKEFKDGMSKEEGVSLAVDIIKKVHEGKFYPQNVEVSVIEKSKGFYYLTDEEIEELL
ncbi:MAG: proteasome endopeptidase complex, subunit alpha [Candidatus Micrarchaeota archaeon]|nr:MAG: proteasome endopeptidase complex, subunit alpha [Candidatus Micrarchaeota archaeon]